MAQRRRFSAEYKQGRTPNNRRNDHSPSSSDGSASVNVTTGGSLTCRKPYREDLRHLKDQVISSRELYH